MLPLLTIKCGPFVQQYILLVAHPNSSSCRFKYRSWYYLCSSTIYVVPFLTSAYSNLRFLECLPNWAIQPIPSSLASPPCHLSKLLRGHPLQRSLYIYSVLHSLHPSSQSIWNPIHQITDPIILQGIRHTWCNFLFIGKPDERRRQTGGIIEG